MATHTQIRAAVLRNLDRAGVSTTESGDVTTYLNQLTREVICAEHNWAFMRQENTITSVDGTDTYSFTETATGRFKDAERMYFRATSSDDYVRLVETTEQALLEGFTEQVEDKPLVWSYLGSRQFRVRPIPDASTYTFRVFTWEYPADLSADGDTNELTNYHSQLLEWGATARGLLQYGEFDQSQLWDAKFRAEFERSLKLERQVKAPTDRVMRISSATNRVMIGLRRSIRMYRSAPYSWI